MSNQVIIFDSTLRDGEQSLQTSINSKKKLEIALALEDLGVDIIELGFPISSPNDFSSVKTIAPIIQNSLICCLARCVSQDIDIAAEAMQAASQFRIHLFLATSPLHIKYKLKKTFNDILDMAVCSVKYARNYTDDIEFSCEDAGRTSIDDLSRIIEATINAGATTINIPDTVGYTIPSQFGNIITSLYNKVSNIDKAIISVHCHNDLGMAVGNSITAIQSGARQIECTINGIGERAGNAALEEVVMAIKVHHNLLNVHTNISHKKIFHTSKLISKLYNLDIPDNKAIIGNNAFSHSSGIHQDGMIKNQKNYEIISPQEVGIKNTKLNLTSKSGRAVIKYYMTQMGYKNNDYDINYLYKKFLKLTEKKGQIFDYDLEILAFLKETENNYNFYKLEKISIELIYPETVTVLVKLNCGGKTHKIYMKSTNTINAIYEALCKITGLTVKFKNYKLVINQNNGYKIISKVNIMVEYNGRYFYGIGCSPDILESSISAMLIVLNTIEKIKQVKIKRNANKEIIT